MNRAPALLAAALLLAAGAAVAQPPVAAAFRIVATDSLPGSTRVVDAEGQAWFAAPEVLLDQDSFGAATARPGEGDTWFVDITMTPDGRDRLAELTMAHKGERLGMFIEGKLVAAPEIRATITEGRALVTGRFTADEARRIAAGVMGRR
ncbi:MAG TPA: hypothetical protein PLQ13_10285 [Candidatus Krumholzibacteria bacterium]|nr:hypothetical protein [Candidatus Krumholzibacteria bacterium]